MLAFLCPTQRPGESLNPPPETELEGAPGEASGPAPRGKFAAKKKRAARAAATLTVVVLVIASLLVALYLNRRAAARALLIGWLEDRGAPAEVQIERLELDGLTARVRIGDPRNPDVVIERVEVDYVIGLPWSREGSGVRPGRVRLLRPVVRARWLDGRLSLGSLDPILQEFSGGQTSSDARGPVVVVEDGRMLLAGLNGARGGELTVRGDARLNDGRLMRLRAEIPSTGLDMEAAQGGRVSAADMAARLDLNVVGDRMRMRLEAAASRAAVSGGAGAGVVSATGAEGVTLSLRGDLPYPDLKRRRGDGRVVINGQAAAARFQSGGTWLNQAALDIDFDGVLRGWVETFAIEGLGRAALNAGRIEGPTLAGRDVRAEISPSRVSLAQQGTGLDWRVNGPVRVTAASARTGELVLTKADFDAEGLAVGGRGAAFEMVGPWTLRAQEGQFGDLSLRSVQGRAELDVTQDAALLVRADATLTASGGSWPLMGVPTAEDGPDLAEMKRALGDFSVDLPRLRLLAGSAGAEVILAAPATLRPRNGGLLTLVPARQALYAAPAGALGGGTLSLTAARGRGLPDARIDIPEWRLTPAGFEARLAGQASLDFDVARGLDVVGAGLLAARSGTTTFAPDGCPGFTVARLELGENDVENVSGRLCASDRPLIELTQGGWRADGRLEDVAGVAPFLEARFENVGGRLAVRGGPDRMELDVAVASARLEDIAEPRRFHPLSAEGRARLANEVWAGDFVLASDGRPIASVGLRHDGPSERGGLTFDTGEIAFAPQGLQPHDLTPLTVGAVQSPVVGSVWFAGRFDWDPALPEGGASSGRLTVPNLDFESPAGPVKGLSGTVDFTSLAPLTTAEGQMLHVDALETVTPLTDLGLTFTLGQAALRVEGGRIQAAGGALRLEPLSVPLDGKQPFDGVIALDRVQLGDLIASAGFDDRVTLDAVVSGRLPFHWDPETGVTVTGGILTADQPGRVSIRREALSGLSAGGGGAEIPPGTVEDLAYQAMENLAFNDLDAAVNSLDGGRVGILFRIKGRHDPPQRQDLRLSLSELISRRFLERRLPLPSDTGIDQTLDTSLNLNELIQDLLEAQRASRPEAAP